LARGKREKKENKKGSEMKLFFSDPFEGFRCETKTEKRQLQIERIQHINHLLFPSQPGTFEIQNQHKHLEIEPF